MISRRRTCIRSLGSYTFIVNCGIDKAMQPLPQSCCTACTAVLAGTCGGGLATMRFSRESYEHSEAYWQMGQVLIAAKKRRSSKYGLLTTP